MRIRTIKPEFWTDEKVGDISITARLLFIALLNQSDDEGNLLCSLKQIKIHAFPYDNFSNDQIVTWLMECVSQDLLRCYVINGKSYLHITNFHKHQKINRPSPAQHPKFIESSLNNHILLIESSKRKEGRKEGMEKKGKENEEEEEEEIISFELIDNIFKQAQFPGSREFYEKMTLLQWKLQGDPIKDIIAFTFAHIDKQKGMMYEKHETGNARIASKPSTRHEKQLTRAEQRKLQKQRTTATE